MQPELFVKLHRIVMGWIASDVDPDWPQETQERALDLEIESALAGRLVGEVCREHDEKN